MSEFECVNGHLMTGSRCGVCGGKVYYMDGCSAQELQRMEEWDEKEFEDDLEEEVGE